MNIPGMTYFSNNQLNNLARKMKESDLYQERNTMKNFDLDIANALEDGKRLAAEKKAEELKKLAAQKQEILKVQQELEFLVSNAIKKIPEEVAKGATYVVVDYYRDEPTPLDEIKMKIKADHFVAMFKNSQIATAKVVSDHHGKHFALHLHFPSQA